MPYDAPKPEDSPKFSPPPGGLLTVVLICLGALALILAASLGTWAIV
jgi:hypothetical protein